MLVFAQSIFKEGVLHLPVLIVQHKVSYLGKFEIGLCISINLSEVYNSISIFFTKLASYVYVPVFSVSVFS